MLLKASMLPSETRSSAMMTLVLAHSGVRGDGHGGDAAHAREGEGMEGAGRCRGRRLRVGGSRRRAGCDCHFYGGGGAGGEKGWFIKFTHEAGAITVHGMVMAMAAALAKTLMKGEA